MPSNKVVVGVTSYGRSFAMADASCYGPTCLYTGTASQSNAEVGPCTGTAGYISNAEINDIITNNASRINQNFIDSTSNSRIVIYDNIQWVATMDDAIRNERETLYAALHMGGSTNWASDLETYNDAPGGKTWATFHFSVKSGLDPWDELTPTGNCKYWARIPPLFMTAVLRNFLRDIALSGDNLKLATNTKQILTPAWLGTDLTCTDESVENLALSPSERWAMFDGANAWADLIKVWSDTDSKEDKPFIFSISNSLHGHNDANCGLLVASDCDEGVSCSDFPGVGINGQAVPAAYEIWNSFVIINQVCKG